MTGQLASVFLNWMMLHVAGLVSEVIIFDRVFSRRHSMTVWALYFGIRAVIRAYMSAAMATGIMGPGLLTFDIIFVIVTAVANFAVLWYTWDGEAVKIGITGILCDLLTGIAMVISISAANALSGGSFTPEMISLSPVMTAAAGTGLVLLVLGMIRLLKPVTRWFGTAELQHRGVLAAIVIISAALFSLSNLTDTAGFNASAYIVCIVAALLLVPVAFYAVEAIEMQRNRGVLLRQQAGMTSAYMLALDSQTGSLASHRQLLDSVASQIESSGSRLADDGLRTYINDLKARTDALKVGRYSSNIAVDAVLTSFAGRFEALGCGSELRADAIDADDTRAAEISSILLNWAETAVSRAKGSKNGPVSVSYSMMQRGGQLMFDLSVKGAGRLRFPERLLRGYMGRSGVMSQNRGRNVCELRLMTAAGAAAETRKEAE